MPLCYTASRAILLCHIDYWLANVCRAYESLLIKYIIADLLICHCNVLIFMAFSRGGITNDSLHPQIPSWCDPEWEALMQSCWASDLADRPSLIYLKR
jgi:hypothetical protein